MTHPVNRQRAHPSRHPCRYPASSNPPSDPPCPPTGRPLITCFLRSAWCCQCLRLVLWCRGAVVPWCCGAVTTCLDGVRCCPLFVAGRSRRPSSPRTCSRSGCRCVVLCPYCACARVPVRVLRVYMALRLVRCVRLCVHTVCLVLTVRSPARPLAFQNEHAIPISNVVYGPKCANHPHRPSLHHRTTTTAPPHHRRPPAHPPAPFRKRGSHRMARAMWHADCR